MNGKITAIITSYIDINTLKSYIAILHNNGFILVITKEKPNTYIYKNYHINYYEFENQLHIIKINKNTLNRK